MVALRQVRAVYPATDVLPRGLLLHTSQLQP
jgi:hypothetical protein